MATVYLQLDTVRGHTADHTAPGRRQLLHLDAVHTRTRAEAPRASRFVRRTLFGLDASAGQSASSWHGLVDGVTYAAFDLVDAGTSVALAPRGRRALLLDAANGATVIDSPAMHGRAVMTLATVTAGTNAVIAYRPDHTEAGDSNGHAGIAIAVDLHGMLALFGEDPQ